MPEIFAEPALDVRPWGVVRVIGPDAAKYLQGQISQDVDALESDVPAWSLLLDPGGKLVAWFRIRRVADEEFMLDMEPGVVDDAVARLTRFKLRTDAEISAEDGWVLTSHLSDGAPAGLEGLSADLSWPGFDASGTLAQSSPPSGTLASDAIEEARIRAAVPRMGVDIDADTIPGEGGRPFLDLSVSFSKGCYTGQELVARIDSRGGNVPRPLRVLEADEALAIDASVEFNGQEVGTVTSAVATVGLARLLRKVEIGADVVVAGAAARVIAPTG